MMTEETARLRDKCLCQSEEIERLREELAAIKAQPAQEPVAWMHSDIPELIQFHQDENYCFPLYTAQQPAPYVEAALNLAREALKDIAEVCDVTPVLVYQRMEAIAREALTSIDAAMKGQP